MFFFSNFHNFKEVISHFFNFLSARNIFICNSIFSLKTAYNGFDFLGWNFLKLKNGFFCGNVSLNSIRKHKSKLKLVIKNFGNRPVFSLINIINKLIFNWSLQYSCSDCSWDIWGELDIYLYKLLWKWARRRHPRRPKTWIYQKYWKFVGSNWRFFSSNVLNGSVYFLRSHSQFNSLVYRLPASLNPYNLYNNTKVVKCQFKSFLSLFKGVFRILWVNQEGICFSCKRTFNFSTSFDFKVSKISKSNNNILNLVLLHRFCNI